MSPLYCVCVCAQVQQDGSGLDSEIRHVIDPLEQFVFAMWPRPRSSASSSSLFTSRLRPEMI